MICIPEGTFTYLIILMVLVELGRDRTHGYYGYMPAAAGKKFWHDRMVTSFYFVTIVAGVIVVAVAAQCICWFCRTSYCCRRRRR